jgi:hypothetical protein
VVLLILVLVWAAVLGPSLLRRGTQRRSTDSIGAFHRQLRVLQRTGPSIVDPLHRLDTSLPSTQIAHRSLGGGRTGLIVVRPDAVVPASQQLAGRSASRRPDPYFRPEACKRRRDVFAILVLTIVFSGSLAVIPAARLVLIFTGLLCVALVGYVALLVQMCNRARERELKLRYLPEPPDLESDILARRVAAR